MRCEMTIRPQDLPATLYTSAMPDKGYSAQSSMAEFAVPNSEEESKDLVKGKYLKSSGVLVDSKYHKFLILRYCVKFKFSKSNSVLTNFWIRYIWTTFFMSNLACKVNGTFENTNSTAMKTI